jgi:hypothetical protein
MSAADRIFILRFVCVMLLCNLADVYVASGLEEQVHFWLAAVAASFLYASERMTL